MSGPNGATQSRWQQFQELAMESARTQLRIAKQYVDATQNLGREGWAEAPDLKRLQAEGERYLRELSQLNLRYARSVQDLARESSQRLFSTADEHGHHHHDSPVRVVLDISGEVGGRASGSFTVANTRPETARVSFEAAQLRAAHGAAFQAVVSFDPAGIDLAPGAEAPVAIGVELDAAHFRAGERYVGEVRVHGGSEVILDLTVQVLEQPTVTVSAGRLRGAAAPSVRVAKKAPAKKAAPKKTPPKKTAAKKTSARKTVAKKAPAKKSAAARRTPPRQA